MFERLGLLLLLAVVGFMPLIASAQIREAKRILIVADQVSAPAVEAVTRVFENNLTAHSPDPVEFFRESLDTILIPEGDFQADVRKWYERKYSQRKLDLIVTVGPASHEFVVKERARYFPDVPLVFCLDIKPDQEVSASDPNATGVWLEFDPVATLNAARQLLPATKHVAVVAGSGFFDQAMLKTVRSKLQGYQGVEFTYFVGLDIPALLEKVRGLPQDTIVLYLTVTKDRSERHMFVTYTLPLVSAASAAPVFGMIDLMVVRNAIVGGRVVSLEEQGLLASEIALRIQQGKTPQDLPPVTATNRYSFDWKQLHRWGLDASRLPPGSVILNREPSVWQRYKQVILGALGLIVFLAGVVVYLLIERAKRLRVQKALVAHIEEKEKAEAALMHLSGRLISAQEEERSRIARELHDDFSQRLAVLAINLKRAIRAISSEPQKAVEQVSELCEQTNDIGADLHKMSRNLHSSTLDVLGLVEGIRSLCKEFTEQQGLQVEFSADGVPRAVPSPISLCFFRIAQEALSNAKKHSGASNAVVELHGSAREIALSVTDSGVGFDPSDPAFKAGLGLQSMRERLRAVGGTLDIDSQTGSGTQILAHVALS